MAYPKAHNVSTAYGGRKHLIWGILGASEHSSAHFVRDGIFPHCFSTQGKQVHDLLLTSTLLPQLLGRLQLPHRGVPHSGLTYSIECILCE